MRTSSQPCALPVKRSSRSYWWVQKNGTSVKASAAPSMLAAASLALALRMHPVLDAHAFVAVRITRDVAGGVVAGDRGLQLRVDEDAVVDLHPRRGGERGARRHAGTHDAAGRRSHALPSSRVSVLPSNDALGARWKTTPCSRCRSVMKPPSSRPSTRSIGTVFRRDHMHFESARAQRGRGLEADETGADERDRTRAGASP